MILAIKFRLGNKKFFNVCSFHSVFYNDKLPKIIAYNLLFYLFIHFFNGSIVNNNFWIKIH